MSQDQERIESSPTTSNPTDSAAKEDYPVGNKRPLALLALIVALLALAAVWRWTSLHDWLAPEFLGSFIRAVPSPGMRALIAVAAITVASLAMVPVTLLAVVAGIVFEGWDAFVYVLAGVTLGSAIGFAGGQFLGHGAVAGRLSSRLGRLSERLAKRGVLAVAVLRLVPIAPFPIFNLAAGASHISLWKFLLGSLLGMAPGIYAITVLSSALWGQ